MLNINEARKLVLDLGRPRLSLYWIDFLVSYGVGVIGFVFAYGHAIESAPFWAWALVSMLGFYRALAFIHEISHFKQRLGLFRLAWNALAGMPMAFPSFMYTKSHAVHHNPKTYGTPADGEYVAFHVKPRWHVVLYLLSSFWTPPLLVLRFAILFPFSLVSPVLRKFLVERGSSVVIAMDHVGEWPVGSEKKEWFVMETACCVYWLSVLSLTFAGAIPWRVLGVSYLILSGALFLNSMRTLAAHRFANDGRVLTIEEQLLDSVNLVSGFPGWILSALAAPAGLRYHALHHLFPFIPYHSLGKAHRRLALQLPKTSSYHLASESGVFSAFLKLWRRPETLPQTLSSEPV